MKLNGMIISGNLIFRYVVVVICDCVFVLSKIVSYFLGDKFVVKMVCGLL